ncbi:hypothetical protein QTN47_11280 [Danxiaibacter flavus]|uniref:Uncharacterized protein n=1 Tax=Danxiaibacter flavus TaxID=3049108 RepID=A0ABV3ZG62_9BACT|nr:hypothetical protein QNM32_11285 [Chitinophagaceae bacterium DXS]
MSDPLSRYAFLPWARRGIAAKIEELENLGNFATPPAGGWTIERAVVDVVANISASKGATNFADSVTQQVSLVAPGDITSLNTAVIVKTEPKNGITNFLPNYFPYIEFYEEDLPWKYSPAKANNHQLRPWIMLLALKEDEFKNDTGIMGALPSIQILPLATDPSGTTGAQSGALPTVAELWAWAHVHLNGDLDSTDLLSPDNANDVNTALDRFRQLVDSNPDRAYSRIICPRKLEPFTTYYCFLVPTYETGRLAGLGAEESVIQTHKAQEPSFGIAHLNDEGHLPYVDHFPVYFQWQFMTGKEGDFETLVRKLKPREVDPKVGTREMDIQQPGMNVNFGAGPVFNNGILMLEGAVLPPGTYNTRLPYPWSVAASSTAYRKKLAGLVNLGEDMMEATFPPALVQPYTTNPYGYTDPLPDIKDDPLIVPDLYGRWHALTRKLDASDTALNNNNSWLYELNLDPRSRAVAGVGVKYVKKRQEEIMDKAWGQLGEVIEANRKLKWGQHAQQVSNAGYNKHLKNQPAEQKAAIGNKMFRKVKSGSVTAFKKMEDSAVPDALYSYAYRKVERPNGPVMKRLDPAKTIFKQNSLRINLANNVFPAVAPKTVSSLQSVLTVDKISVDVEIVSNYKVASAMFAPTNPGNISFKEVADFESESRFQTAVMKYNDYFESTNWQGIPAVASLDVNALSTDVIAAINPIFTIAAKVYGQLQFMPGYTMPPADKIVPVMAYPVFNTPTYQSVVDLGVDYFCPNLGLIPKDTITLVESNQRFIEAFMVGLNHETGRELLWREFPTDQRGSYFRQFWDSSDAVNTGGLSDVAQAEQNLDIKKIHEWPTNSTLGTHSARVGMSTPNPLILVIRGELLNRFPDTVIYAQRAAFNGSDTQAQRLLGTDLKYPLFSAHISPDLTFIGFDLTAAAARGNRDGTPPDPGWFFVIQERPGEIRFGLDTDTSATAPRTWNDLSQGNAAFRLSYLNATNNAVVPTDDTINGKHIPWGFNSTNMAEILYQNPVLLAVHADDMLP